MSRAPRCWGIAAALAVAACGAIAAPACAAGGDPDPSFGSGGVVTTDMGGGSASATDVAVQANGDIVAAGYVTGPDPSAPGSLEITVVRYSADGSLDRGFGDGGRAVAPGLDSQGTVWAAIAPASGGKVLVGGVSRSGGTGPSDPSRLAFSLVRLNADGSPDTSFGSGGRGSIDLGQNASSGTVFDVVEQSDGKVVLTGLVRNGTATGTVTLARFGADGAPDTTYGNGGLATLPFKPSQTLIRSVRAGSDLAVAFCEQTRVGANPTVVKVDAAGSVDAAFTPARATFGCGRGHDVGLALQPDGKLVLGSGSIDLARFDADGSPDSSFGAGGESTTSGGSDTLGVGVQSDGGIVAGGGTFGVARFEPHGALDPGFDASALSGGGAGRSLALALDASDRPVLAGSTADSSAFVVERFLSSPPVVAGPVAATQSLATVLSNGIAVPVACSTACTATSQLLAPPSALGAARLVVVGHASKRLRHGGRAKVRVRLSRRAKKHFRGRTKVRLVLVTKVVPKHGKARTRRQHITLKR